MKASRVPWQLSKESALRERHWLGHCCLKSSKVEAGELATGWGCVEVVSLLELCGRFFAGGSAAACLIENGRAGGRSVQR